MIEFIKFHNPIEFVIGSFSEGMTIEDERIESIIFDGHCFIVSLKDEVKRLMIPASSVAFSRVRNVKDKEISSSERVAKVKTKGKKKV